MWQLSTTQPGKEWSEIGRFETLTAAAQRIRELEDYPSTGIFLEFHVDTQFGSDDEALSVFHHTGRRALYGIRRRVN